MHGQSETMFNLTFERQAVTVKYTPRYFTGYDHFEFISPFHPRRPIPVSETGYKSHFVPSWELESETHLATFAHEIMVLMLAAARNRDIDPDQATLF